MARWVLAIILACMVVGVASADKLPFSGDGARDGREGGEDWNSAVVISALPYTDTGATCDNNHTVDFSCGYTAGISPDVFYSITPTANCVINISLCGSAYDTQLAVFNSGHGEMACNDDFCGLQSEIDGVAVSGGQQYFIVVSGFYGGCGSYTINVTGDGCFQPVPTQELSWGHIKSLYH